MNEVMRRKQFPAFRTNLRADLLSKIIVDAYMQIMITQDMFKDYDYQNAFFVFPSAGDFTNEDLGVFEITHTLDDLASLELYGMTFDQAMEQSLVELEDFGDYHEKVYTAFYEDVAAAMRHYNMSYSVDDHQLGEYLNFPLKGVW